jgi:hypothetical protein
LFLVSDYVLHAADAKFDRNSPEDLGERDFSFAGPAVWNFLPASLQDICHQASERNLKTETLNNIRLFVMRYWPWFKLSTPENIECERTRT